MPPDNCQGNLLPKPVRLTSSRPLATRASRSALAIAHDFERQRDIARDACARDRAPAPGTHSHRRASARASCGLMPLTRMTPLVGVSRSAIARSSVVLPQPEGPMKETNSPRSTLRLMPLSACTGPSRGLEASATDRRRRSRCRADASAVRLWRAARACQRATAFGGRSGPCRRRARAPRRGRARA